MLGAAWSLKRFPTRSRRKRPPRSTRERINESFLMGASLLPEVMGLDAIGEKHFISGVFCI